MVIDCETCAVRDIACGECVIGVLLGAPTDAVLLDAPERRALGVLADQGLVPHLRLVSTSPRGPDDVPVREAG